MKRRLLSLMLLLAMVFTLVPVQALATGTESPADTGDPFLDVDKGAWYYDAVQYARVNGFFTGTSETTFAPNGTMTRGMFVTVLGRMACVDAAAYAGETAFSDVRSDAYYAPYVAWAAKHGITTGTGDGAFSPDEKINRQQMATFFVRYFEAFDVDYETGANITTTPADIDSVAPWARDAVLKLWRTGLLNGDGTSFDPAGSASRAQAATICYRADEAVDTWYSEPGVPAERVRLNPATGLPYGGGGSNEPAPTPAPAAGSGSSGSSGNGGTTTTKYYEVQFALGSGEDAAGVTLPEKATYAKGTPITSLPTPTAEGKTFLGWYYDAAMTEAVGNADKVTRNMTLYAKLGAFVRDALTTRDEPNYITNAEAATDFVLTLSGDCQDGDLTITDVSAGNAQVQFTVNADGTVTITGVTSEVGGEKTLTSWEAGHTYQAELAEDSTAVFVYNGTQDASVRVFNIITVKDEVDNLRVDESIKFIPKDQAKNMTGAMAGLFTLTLDESGQGQTQQNNSTGSFTYNGDGLNVGDTAAIYEGKDPKERGATDIDGDIVYVTITGKTGTTYTYRTADAENVLFTPDILPVSNGEDLVTDDVNTLTVDVGVFNFTAPSELQKDMGLDAATTVDVGDFVALYDGTNARAATEVAYGKITGIQIDVLDDADVYVITYTPVDEDAVLASMDLYQTENREIELSEKEIEDIEQDMLTQAIESGFTEAAAEYLMALALETDGFQELADSFELEDFTMSYADGSPVDRQTMTWMRSADGKPEISKKEFKPKVTIGELDHFKDKGKGVKAQLEMTLEFEVKIGKENKVKITLQAIFEQEILINFTKSGGAVWKKAWIFPYIADYQMTANIDLGTYTGIGITATAQTAGEDEKLFDWNNTSGTGAEQKILNIGKQIEELMKKKDKFMNYPLIGGDDDDDDDDGGGIPIDGGLPEKYAAMIENAEDSWIDIFRVTIFEKEGAVDKLHILAYKVGADFVVSANLYVTMGLTFDYAVAKRYSFSLSLFSRKCTNNVVDLETAHYEFAFYVMGTVGIRAGVEFEIAIGLFSTKLDSIGICAEAGVYAQMWGYFYYQLSWQKGSPKQSQYNGAMYIDIGAYLKISFKAQAFSNDKLTWKPTLFEKEWPFYSVGEQENVLDFFLEEDDEDLDIELIDEKTVTLPTSVLTMKYLDMKTGEMGGEEDDDGNLVPGKIFDDATESRFKITFSDPEHFSYDAKTNTITVTPKTGEGRVDGEMTLTWLGCKLSFNSNPIQRTVKITWLNPDAQYITFDSNGGSRRNSVSGVVDAAIEWPEDPTKTGYHFGGWYTDADFNTSFAPITTMPDFKSEGLSEGMGLKLYAKWEPNTDTRYFVDSYRQQTNGTYKKACREERHGTTDAVITVTPITTDGERSDYSQHFASPVYDGTTTIAPDGSTVLRVYYDRNIYTHTFTYGDKSAGNANIVYKVPYEGDVYSPALALPGYRFSSFSGYTSGMTSTGTQTYNAQWTPRDDTPYRVAHYIARVFGGGYLLSGDDAVQTFYGTTDSTITPAQIENDGLTYTNTMKVNGQTATTPTIAADGSTIVELYYDRTPFTVTWNANGGAFEDPGAGTASVVYGARLTAPTPSNANGDLKFDGWYTDSGCTERMPENMTMPDSDLTLYARWVDDKLAEGEYRISYAGLEGVDGYPGSSYPTVYTAGSAAITLPTPSRDGYTFTGWTGTGLTEKTMTVTIPTGSTGARSYIANWTENSHTITYYVVDNNEPTKLTGLTPNSYTEAEAAEGITLAIPGDIKGDNYGKEGYVIDGWYNEPDFSGTPVTAIPEGTNIDLTYYGKWVKAPLTVQYEVLGHPDLDIKKIEALFGDGTELPSQVEAGTELPTNTKETYEIFRWCYAEETTDYYGTYDYKYLKEDAEKKVKVTEEAMQAVTGNTLKLCLIYVPAQICSSYDLMGLGYLEHVNETYSDYRTIPSSSTFTLINDITLDKKQADAWRSIWNLGGTFNGNGKKIIYDDDVTEIKPLFASVTSGGTVKDLTVQLPATTEVTAVAPQSQPNCWGAVVANITSSTGITNCHVTGGTINSDIRYTGGVVGRASIGSGSIQNCTVGEANNKRLILEYTGANASNVCVGGVVGCLEIGYVRYTEKANIWVTLPVLSQGKSNEICTADSAGDVKKSSGVTLTVNGNSSYTWSNT